MALQVFHSKYYNSAVFLFAKSKLAAKIKHSAIPMHAYILLIVRAL